MKKALWTLAFCICSLGLFAAESKLEKGIEDLANKLLPPVEYNHPKPSVAIMTFSFDKKVPSFESYIGTVVFEKLFATGKLKLIERENIDKVLSEQKFQLSGNVDDNSAKSIGNIVGVDYVCYGTITELDTVIRVSGKMVDVLTGEIISIASVNIEKDQTTDKLLGNTKSGTTTTPTQNSDQLKSFWKVEKEVNDFDNYTAYLFTLKSSPTFFISISIILYTDSSRSVVYSGIYWNGYGVQNFEIKGDDGQVHTLYFPDWCYYLGSTSELKHMGTDKPRSFLNILLNNNKLTIRAKKDEIRTFTTYGLAEAIASAGLKYSDFDKAMKNREF